MDLTLAIGNKNYSSWSLRAWLAARRSGAEFEEIVIPLDQPGSAERKREYSPTGKVPALRHGNLGIWESLAICEYLAELFPAAKLWPADAKARALARAVSNEMHAGFQSLRSELPMNVRACHQGRARSPATEADIQRILSIWRETRERFGRNGPFLFGEFSIADAMYAPVAFRFATYGVPLSGPEAAYSKALLATPELIEWADAARAEPWSMPKYDEIH